MKSELTKSLFTACIVTFFVTMVTMLWVLQVSLYIHNMTDLRDRTKEAAAIINTVDPPLHLPSVSGYEQTALYDSSGTLLLPENGVAADPEALQEALTKGSGSSSHYQDGLLKRTLYCTIRLDNGNVLQISRTIITIWALLLDMVLPLAVVMLCIVLLSVLLSTRFTTKIMQPISRLDADNPDDRDIYPELKPVLRKLITQNQQIHQQMDALQEEHRKQDALRREFTANVSHELKTPLTSISGFAEIMRNGIVKEKDIPHFSDNIYHEAQRLILLVNDILKLSRLEDTDSQREERAPVALLGLCREVASRLSLQAVQKDITLSCEGDEVTIEAMPRLLEEIIFNVCDNAIKYNRDGGYVRMTVGMRGERAFVRVTDNGIGIPAEKHDRLFERFYRVDMSHSREVGGTGLGLSIVKHGMMLHGGDVELQSEPGKGTDICLLFPLTGTDAAKSP